MTATRSTPAVPSPKTTLGLSCEDWLASARQYGHIGYLDEQLTRALLRLTETSSVPVAMVCALLSQQVGVGHVCLPLESIAELPPWSDGAEQDLLAPLRALAVEALVTLLQESGLAGDDGQRRPLVLDRGRLYQRRLFEHEAAVAERLEARLQRTWPVDPQLLSAMDRLFPPSVAEPGAGQMTLGFTSSRPVDYQRRAAEVALERALTVVSGGPGTGKTSTVVKILALLVEQALAENRPAPRMLLLAPTGKAAARLAESIASARSRIPCTDAVRVGISATTQTIHRALGVRPMGGVAHDARRPFAADVVLVDEASMVDLALMRKLLDAVPESARLILLGDRDQLASVEAGAVLGDICGAGLSEPQKSAAPLRACIVQLERSYRYHADSGIGVLAKALRRGDSKPALEVLASPQFQDVLLHSALPGDGLGQAEREICEGYRAYLEASSAAYAHAAFDRFRVLCARRTGAWGVEGLNQAIERALARRGLLPRRGAGNYRGRPVMISRNNPGTRLNNGDVGLIWPRPASLGSLAATFPSGDGELRWLSPARLPPHDTVFAMTIHKSQGTEFDHVLIVLPPEASPLVCRELLYTAVTRAKQRVSIYASADVVRAAIEQPIVRRSGLQARLWGLT